MAKDTYSYRGYEKGEMQPFWMELLRDLGIEHPAGFIEFEKPVKLEKTEFIDALIPATHVLIEQKSRGVDLYKKYKQSDGAMKTPFGQALRYNEKLPYSQKARWIITCNFDEIHIHDLEGPSEVPDVVVYLSEDEARARESFGLCGKDKKTELASPKAGQSLANPGGSARGQSSASRSNKNNLKRKKDPDPFEIEAPLHSKALRSQLSFITDIEQARLHQEKRISLEAGRLVGKLYDGLLKQYLNPNDPQTLQSLNKLCVRLVFCLYAEDTNGAIFDKNQFHDYLANKSPQEIRAALIELFRALNLDHEARKKEYLTDEARAFPYVNGGLFADENVEIPFFTQELKALLLDECSLGFDWSPISPTIFGSLFESTLNKETRRKNGMHYTTVQNIHKVIDPLFLDALKAELASLKEKQSLVLTKGQRARFKDEAKLFQNKLAKLRFLDPACGSGNFLTETYLSLRRLENEALLLMQEDDQIRLGFAESEYNPIKVSISQFYGIEINDFAVAVAKTALWIAEAQMRLETEDILSLNLDFLPLTTNAGIVEGNALRMDWQELVDKRELDYIIGNPPYVGYSLKNKQQREEISSVYVDESQKPYESAGKIDYIAAWFFKASQIIDGTQCKVAFVSTKSITQGEQVPFVWKPLYDRFNIHIDFAYRSFKWDSESNEKAQVFCVIIGFSSCFNPNQRVIFDGEKVIEVNNINPYLINAENCYIKKRKKPLRQIQPMLEGSKPSDGGFLILTEKEKNQLLKKEPQAQKLIRPFMMGKDFINRSPRYCIWLPEADPALLNSCPEIKKRISKVKEFRTSSKKAATRRKAQTPGLFDEIHDCKTDYVAIPVVSSGTREYIPIDYLDASIIPGNKLFTMENADLYHFGVLTSKSHMAWMRTVSARLGESYSYSNTVTYNNFPWPDPTPEQEKKIEQTAQGILNARQHYPDASLADLYNDLTMPTDLRKAHFENDRAVMEAYGFDKNLSEQDIVAKLFKRYQELVEKEI